MGNLSKNLRISVFIPTFDCRPWLYDTIKSMLDQSFSNLDVYVVDDASGDVDDWLLAQYPSVSFIRMESSVGPYVIDNLLLQKTRSNLVAFQDADDRSLSRRFEKQLSLMQRHELDGCGTWSVHIDLMGDPLGYETFPFDASTAGTTGYLYPLRHPTALFYRYVLDELGGFDGSTKFGADAEYLFRAFLSFKLGNVQEFLYHHMIHPNSLTQNSDTGFNSSKRKAFNEPLEENMRAIISGQMAPPKSGMLLNGLPAGTAEIPEYDVLQIGQGNLTWMG